MPHEVSAEAAYNAALTRALKTTEALVGAEAQILHLTAALGRRSDEADSYRQRYESARDSATRWRRRHGELAREMSGAEDQEEVKEDGAESCCGYAETVSEVVRPADVHS